MIDDKPVAKSFIYNSNCYVYDSSTNAIIQVTEKQFKELQRLFKIRIRKYTALCDNTEEYENILQLLEKGMFKPMELENVEHPASEYVRGLLEHCVNDITLQITKNCNFSCRYCTFATLNKVTRVHQDINMTLDTALKCVDFLYNHCSDVNDLCISFYGGEPLLNFSLIQSVVEYSKKKFCLKRLNFRMTTNASLMTENVLDFLYENDFMIAISLDGDEKRNDSHRRFNISGHGTFSVIYNNLKKIIEKYPDYFKNNVSFLPVVFPDENYDDLYSFFDKLGVDRGQVEPLDVDLNGIDYYPGLYNEIRVKKDHQQNELYSNRAQFDDIFTVKETRSPTWHHNGPCIPGIKRLFITTDGDFFSCEKIPEYINLSIGNIAEGFFVDKILQFMNIGALSKEKCSKCWAWRYCNICYAQCISTDKKELSADSKPCKYQEKLLLDYLMHKINNFNNCN